MGQPTCHVPFEEGEKPSYPMSEQRFSIGTVWSKQHPFMGVLQLHTKHTFVHSRIWLWGSLVVAGT